MEVVRNWWLPAALAAGQAAVWPGMAWALGAPPERGAVAMVLVATALGAAALGWRRSAPVVTLVAETVVLGVGQLTLPHGSPQHPVLPTLDVLLLAAPVALYSVAARRPLRVGLPGLGVVGVVGVGTYLMRFGTGPAEIGEVVAAALVLVLIFIAGRLRHRWRAARQAAAGRLARAEAQGRTAATVERQRLARELHDVAAHHLTSIVVTAGAAERVRERGMQRGGVAAQSGQPDLLAQALAIAAGTGREALAALHRLVAVMGARPAEGGELPLAARVEELAGALRQLGQPVTVTVDGDAGALPAAVDEAAHGIVREALTNALRHARGAAVTVRLDHRPAALRLTVDDDGAGATAGEPLGSGRGLVGMRERAAAVGGSVSAGPCPGGGWRVQAELPVTAADATALPARRGPRIRHENAVDAALALAAVVVPAALAIGPSGDDPQADPPLAPVTVGLVVLLLGAHALPLLWRRRAPWRVLAAVLAANLLWPAAVALKLIPGYAVVLSPGIFAAGVAVYTVATLARPIWLTLLSVPGALAPIALTSGVAFVVEVAAEPPPPPGDLATGVWAGLAGVMVAICLAPVLLTAWAAGLLVQVRKDDAGYRESGALAVAAAEAAYAARTERTRIAAGLRGAVLEHAGRLVAAADAGRTALDEGRPEQARERLAETAEQARAALAAMRELLEMLRGGDAPAELSPQPTAAGIQRLCEEQRTAGRPVVLHTGSPPRRVPAEVDASAYRIVAAALGAGDTGPAEVLVGYGEDDLRIRVCGVPAATTGPVAAGLRVRVTAIGGRIMMNPAGIVDVLLPARVEEVTPSPSV